MVGVRSVEVDVQRSMDVAQGPWRRTLGFFAPMIFGTKMHPSLEIKEPKRSSGSQIWLVSATPATPSSGGDWMENTQIRRVLVGLLPLPYNPAILPTVPL